MLKMMQASAPRHREALRLSREPLRARAAQDTDEETLRRLANGEELVQANFAKDDANADGFVDETELAVALGKEAEDAGRVLAEADLDGDGQISLTEYEQYGVS